MQDIQGQPVPLEKKADALAEYLEMRHWAPIDRQPPPKDYVRPVVDTPLLSKSDPLLLKKFVKQSAHPRQTKHQALTV